LFVTTMDISFIIRAKLIIGSLFKSTAFFKVNIFVICIKKMVLYQSDHLIRRTFRVSVNV